MSSAAPALAAVVDASGAVIDLSASLRETLQIDVPDQTLLWELVHPDDVPRVRAAVSSAFRLDGAVSLTFQILDGAGHWRALDAAFQRQASLPPTLMVTMADASHPLVESDVAGALEGGAIDGLGDLLSTIVGASSRLLERLPPGSPLRTDAATVCASAERAASIVQRILSLSRPQDERATELDLGQAIDEVRPQIGRLLGDRTTLGMERAERVWRVRAHRGAMAQVFLTLAVNARAAMPEGGHVTITVSNWSMERLAVENLPARTSSVVVTVSDTGCGMDVAAQARAFDPFLTSAGPAAAAGLGLATVRAVVEDNGGWVQLRSAPGFGTTVFVGLPPVEGCAPDPLEPAVRAHTLLLVEDEAGVRELVRDMLTDAGYNVLEAAAPSEAERISRERAAPIDLLLTDIVMPEMSGVELSGRLRLARPGLRVMYMSGFPDPGPGSRMMEPADALFLAKPFTRQALLSAVQRAIGGENR